MKRTRTLIAAAALFVTSSGAQAVVVVDLIEDATDAPLVEGSFPSVAYSGFTVTAGGYNSFAGTDYNVYVDLTGGPDHHGLGVDTTGADNPNVTSGDKDDIDGMNDESLIITPDSGFQWRLLAITFVDGDHDWNFNSPSPDDRFDLLIDGTMILDEIPIEANDLYGRVDLTSLGVSLDDLTGGEFQIGADLCGRGGRNSNRCKDSFYVHKIEYERVLVSEPATLGMLGLALTVFGFGFARRRST